MKTWVATIRTDVRFPEKDISLRIKAYNEEHVEDILGVYWVVKIDIAPKLPITPHKDNPFMEAYEGDEWRFDALMIDKQKETKLINTMVDFLINDGDMGCLPNMCEDGSGWVAYQAALKFKKLRKENK